MTEKEHQDQIAALKEQQHKEPKIRHNGKDFDPASPPSPKTDKGNPGDDQDTDKQP